MVSTSVSRIIITSVGLGAVREGCCSCARCACPPEQRTQQRVRRRTGAGRTQASYSYSYSYTGTVPSVAVKEWTRMRAIVGLADVGGERAQMVVSSWHGVRPDLCARPAKTGAFVPFKIVCMRGKRKGPTGANVKLQVALLVSPRVSYKLVRVGRKERPAVQKATATAPWTLILSTSGKERHKAPYMRATEPCSGIRI